MSQTQGEFKKFTGKRAFLPPTFTPMKKNNKPEKQKRYALLLRCSNDDKKKGDYSTIDSQRDANTLYVAERGGIVVGEYVDDGVTGTTLKRPGFRRMMEDARQDLFDVVVVTYMSRLARGTKFWVAYHQLEDENIAIETSQEQYNDDLAGQTSREFTVLMDGVYPKQISLWTKTKQAQMVKRGYFTGGVVPLGYKLVPITNDGVSFDSDEHPPKRLVPDRDAEQDQAAVVLEAYTLMHDRKSISVVRDFLMNTTGQMWSYDKVKRLLSNEKYKGVLAYGPNRNESAHEAIVPNDLWESVQLLLEKPASKPPRTKEDYTYYLDGRVWCDVHDCLMTPGGVPRPGGRVHYYQCLFQDKGHGVCPIKRINADVLHHTVLLDIQRSAEHSTVMHSHIASTGGWSKANDAQKYKRKHLMARQKENKRQIDAIINAVAAGVNNPSITERLTELEAERRQVGVDLGITELEIAKATVARPTAEQVQSEWNHFLERLENLTEPEKRLALQAMVEEVRVVSKNEITLRVSASAGSLDGLLASEGQLGAGVGLEPTTFGL